MSQIKTLTTASGAPVADNQNSRSAGPRGPLLLDDFHLIEKLAHFNRENIPERRVHAKGSGAYGTFTVTRDITSTPAPSCSIRSVSRRQRSCGSPPWAVSVGLPTPSAIPVVSP